MKGGGWAGGDFVQVAEVFPTGTEPLGVLRGGWLRSTELSADQQEVCSVLSER